MQSDPHGAVFAALAHASRRQIIDVVKDRPGCNVTYVASHFDMSRIAVMKHLKVLSGASLILVERRGRERWNHLNPIPIQRIHRRWIKPFEDEPADGLLRLKARAETGRKLK